MLYEGILTHNQYLHQPLFLKTKQGGLKKLPIKGLELPPPPHLWKCQKLFFFQSLILKSWLYIFVQRFIVDWNKSKIPSETSMRILDKDTLSSNQDNLDNFKLTFVNINTLTPGSLCSFSMMVKWAYDGLLQANARKMLLMMVKCSSMMMKCSLMMVKCSAMMVKWVYNHTFISPSLTSILLALAWKKSSFAHLTIIEKLHQLTCWFN